MIASLILRVLDEVKNPPLARKASNALRFGILGAARIGLNALFTPAKSHSEVIVTAVACRDEARGAQYAKTHGISKVHSGAHCYQGMSCSC